MANIKKFIITSWTWEASVEFDISKYDDVEDRQRANTLIRKEVFKLALEHIKKNKLKVPVGLGIHEELKPEEIIAYNKKTGILKAKDSRFAHCWNTRLAFGDKGSMPAESIFVETPNDLFLGYGEVFYTQINGEPTDELPLSLSDGL